MILVDPSQPSRIMPGTIFMLKLADEQIVSSGVAVRFARESGSNRLCVHPLEVAGTRHLGILVEVVSLSGNQMKVKGISRLQSLLPFEMNPQGGYLMGRFMTVADEPVSNRGRAMDVLVRIKEGLNQQWMLIGETGRARLLSRLSEHSSLLGSVERSFLTSGETEMEMRQSMQHYSSFEKMSFLLLSILALDRATTIQLIDCTDTIVRLDAILASLLVASASSTILIVGSAGETRRGDLLRFNSKYSALILVLVLVLVLFLKGAGYLEVTRGSAYRYRTI